MDAEFLGSSVSRIAGVLRASSASLLEPAGVSPRTFGLLAWLAVEGPAPQAAMCRRSGIDRTSMVALVDRLEADGLVERRRDESDRRVNLVALTGRGRTVVMTHHDALREVEAEVLSPLSEAEVQMLGSLLRTIVANLDDPASA